MEETEGVTEPEESQVVEEGGTPDSTPSDDAASASVASDDSQDSSEAPEGSSGQAVDPNQYKRVFNQSKAAQREAAKQKKENAELKKRLAELEAAQQPPEEGKLTLDELPPDQRDAVKAVVDLAKEEALRELEQKQMQQKYQEIAKEDVNKAKEEFKRLFDREMTEEELDELQKWNEERGKGIYMAPLQDAVSIKYRDQYIKKAQVDALKGKVADESKSVETGGKGTGDKAPTEEKVIPKTFNEEVAALEKYF